MKCPNCGYERTAQDTNIPDWQCPSCKKPYQVKFWRSKKARRILLFLGLALAVLFVVLLFPLSTPFDALKKNRNNANEQNSNKKEGDSYIEESINLPFISSKLYEVNVLAKACRDNCEQNHELDVNCQKANTLLFNLSPQLALYKTYVLKYPAFKLTSQEQEFASQINGYLANITNELAIAKTICRTTSINQKTSLLTAGINLSELYSQAYMADYALKQCLFFCQMQEKWTENCNAFAKFDKEYRPELNKLFEVLKTQSLELTADEKTGVSALLEVLKEIDVERKKMANCVETKLK